MSEPFSARLNPSAAAVSLGPIARQLLGDHQRYGWRGVAICAATRRAGVSFLSAGVAVALADMGVSTLLVDANLRHPSLHVLFPPQNQGEVLGLNQLLGPDLLKPDDVIERNVRPQLNLLYAGAATLDGEEKLGGVASERLFRDCLRGYEFTIVDTPAANLSAATLSVSALVGYALVVARKDKSFIPDVGRLVDELQQDNVSVIGTVFNAG